MLDLKNIDNIYNLFITKNEITTKELNELGYNSKQITELIDAEILNRAERGIYKLNGISQLCHYGRRLLSLK